VQEAQWITGQIKTLAESGVPYDSIAILYRAHHVSRSLEEAFIREKIPYVLFSGIEFYKRKEIKDILSYLRMLVYADDLSFKRVVNEPKRNFGKKRMELVQEYALVHNCSLYQALLENLDEPLIEKTQVFEFVSLIERYKKKYENIISLDCEGDYYFLDKGYNI
jgi:DNA helicase-2/ATP-dependent DNA helicase PcrA